MASQVASLHSQKMESEASYSEEKTWDAKAIYIDILEKRGMYEEAVGVARDHARKMREEVGYGNSSTLTSMERYLGLLEFTDKGARVVETGKYLQVLSKELMEGDTKIIEIEHLYNSLMSEEGGSSQEAKGRPDLSN